MKRFFPTGLALLLVMGSLGHVLAAGLCPRSFGRECFFAKTSKHTPDSSSCHQDTTMDLMPMDGMPMDDMAGEDTFTFEIPNQFPPVVDREVLASAFELPVESCAHCMSHSGIPNTPALFVTVPDESRKAVDSVPLPVSSFLGPSLTPIKQFGSPREHAPPGTSAPRYVLISAFLI
jgi:hypothetical protein